MVFDELLFDLLGGLFVAWTEPTAEPEASTLGDRLFAVPATVPSVELAADSPVDATPFAAPMPLPAVPETVFVRPEVFALPFAEPLPLAETPSTLADLEPLVLNDGVLAADAAVPTAPCVFCSAIMDFPLMMLSDWPAASVAVFVMGEILGETPALPVALPLPDTVGGKVGMAPKLLMPLMLPLPPIPPIPAAPPMPPPPPSNPPANAGVASTMVNAADNAALRISIPMTNSSVVFLSAEEIAALRPLSGQRHAERNHPGIKKRYLYN